jgi:hypothetical protein
MEDVEVPESLMPEQIEKKIQEIKSPKAKKKNKIYYYGGLLAASLVLVAGIYTMGNHTRMNNVEEGAVPEEAG